MRSRARPRRGLAARQHVVECHERSGSTEGRQDGGPLAARPEAAGGTYENRVEQLERPLRLVAFAREHHLPFHQVDRFGKAASPAQDLAAERRRVALLVELLDAIEEAVQHLVVACAHARSRTSSPARVLTMRCRAHGACAPSSRPA
jgi:hypothetical protein